MHPAIVSAVSWGFTSTALVLLNARLLKQDDFHYPITLCSMGLIASWIMSSLLVSLGYAKLIHTDSFGPRWYIVNALPIGAFSALSLALGNYAYMYLSVSFIHMLKAEGPCVTMIVLFISGVERPSTRMVLGVIIISFGTALAAYDEIQFRWVGVFLMLGSDFSEAFRVVALQHHLEKLKLGLVEGLYIMTPGTLFFLAFAIFIFERDGLRSGDIIHKVVARPHEYLTAASLGFIVNFLTYAVIRSAGSLTLKVCGQAKNALVILSSIYLFHSKVSWTQALGYSLSMLGFLMYQNGNLKKKSLFNVRNKVNSCQNHNSSV
jgi:drug/metabolite transporter (DMT)-like permease